METKKLFIFIFKLFLWFGYVYVLFTNFVNNVFFYTQTAYIFYCIVFGCLSILIPTAFWYQDYKINKLERENEELKKEKGME